MTGPSNASSRASAPRLRASTSNPAAAMRAPPRRVARAARATVAGQFARILHHQRGALVEQQLRDVLGVEHVGPGQHRHAERDRLEQVVAADRHQAAGDEGHVARRIERQQLAERIDQQHVAGGRAAGAARMLATAVAGLRAAGLADVGRATHERHALRLQPVGDVGEAVRMARHQHQQRVVTGGAHRALRLDHRVLLAVMRAAGDPDGPAAGVTLAQGRAALERCPDGSAKSNLMLPVTWVLAGLAPIERKRSASPSLCAAITMPCESVSRNRLARRR